MSKNSTEYNQMYYQIHKERLREIRKKWYEEHADKMKEYRKNYYQNNKDKLNEYRKTRTKKYHYEQLEKEMQETQKTLDHRDTVLSIMYDLVRDNSIPDDRKIRIIMKITSVEAGDDFYEKDEDVINFYKRIFRPYL